jgi:hypothetical protein
MAGLSCPTFERRAHLGNGSVDRSHKSNDRKDHFEEKHHVEIKFLEIEVVLIDGMKQMKMSVDVAISLWTKPNYIPLWPSQAMSNLNLFLRSRVIPFWCLYFFPKMPPLDEIEVEIFLGLGLRNKTVRPLHVDCSKRLNPRSLDVDSKTD